MYGWGKTIRDHISALPTQPSKLEVTFSEANPVLLKNDYVFIPIKEREIICKYDSGSPLLDADGKLAGIAAGGSLLDPCTERHTDTSANDYVVPNNYHFMVDVKHYKNWIDKILDGTLTENCPYMNFDGECSTELPCAKWVKDGLCPNREGKFMKKACPGSCSQEAIAVTTTTTPKPNCINDPDFKISAHGLEKACNDLDNFTRDGLQECFWSADQRDPEPTKEQMELIWFHCPHSCGNCQTSQRFFPTPSGTRIAACHKIPDISGGQWLSRRVQIKRKITRETVYEVYADENFPKDIVAGDKLFIQCNTLGHPTYDEYTCSDGGWTLPTSVCENLQPGSLIFSP